MLVASSNLGSAETFKLADGIRNDIVFVPWFLLPPFCCRVVVVVVAMGVVACLS